MREVLPDHFRIGVDERHQHHARNNHHRQHQPRQRERILAEAGRQPLGRRDQRGADRQSDDRAERDIAKRLGPQRRRKHIGHGDAKLVRRRHPHAENQEPGGEYDDALQAHRPCDEEGADERDREPELDAGLAAIGVGHLADRIRHQEPAETEQADRQAREARRAGDGHDHQRPDPIGQRHAGPAERLRQRNQRGVAFDERRDAGPCGGTGSLKHIGQSSTRAASR